MKAPASSRPGDRRFSSIESTADFLAAEISQGKLTTLCGAGISRNSCLPAAADLTREILSTITQTAQQRHKITSARFASTTTSRSHGFSNCSALVTPTRSTS